MAPALHLPAPSAYCPDQQRNDKILEFISIIVSGLWTPIKTKEEDSPVFSQSVIINFGHNYSVIFVTPGPG